MNFSLSTIGRRNYRKKEICKKKVLLVVGTYHKVRTQTQRQICCYNCIVIKSWQFVQIVNHTYSFNNCDKVLTHAMKSYSHIHECNVQDLPGWLDTISTSKSFLVFPYQQMLHSLQ